jgi:hypothetical protein
MPEEIEVEVEPGRAATHEIAPDDIARTAFKVDDHQIMQAKLNELMNLLWRPEGETEEQSRLRAVRALEHFNSLEPKDGAEGMLALQMVGTHFAALECLRRAALPSQTLVGLEHSLKHAQKLMALYTKQLEALNRHRGKGQQKVTVEHIRVESGGQAIVGSVETGRRQQAESKPVQLEHKPDEAVPLEMPAMKRARPETRK